MSYLFDPPPKYDLPLSQGQDLSVDFRNNPSGDGTTFVDYEPGVTAQLVIKTDPPIVADADIDGYHAYVKIESTVTDDIPGGQDAPKWRYTVTTATVPPTNTNGAIGKVRRFD